MLEGLLLLLALLLLLLVLVLELVVLQLTLLGEGRMRKWETMGIGFAAVLGEGPLGPLCALMRCCVQLIKSVRKKLATRGGLRAFLLGVAVSPHK